MMVQIVYEDLDLIVCVKPAGVLSQGDKAGNRDMVRELKKYLVMEARKNKIKLSKEPYIAVLHRLDRNVRGIMVYAKTKRAATGLSQQIRENRISKKYMAVVNFNILDTKPVINVWENRQDFMVADKLKNLSVIVDEKFEGAEKAELNYRVLKVLGNKALIEIDLITGRHHQIRLQLSQVFNGIVGDMKYNKDYKDIDGWQELALEAVRLSFIHPISDKKMDFVIPVTGKEFGEFNAENHL